MTELFCKLDMTFAHFPFMKLIFLRTCYYQQESNDHAEGGGALKSRPQAPVVSGAQ